mmetsp:Transcript_3681/g.7999  ORF Transcript_3681/g.7999 Transcript_3681/m.7999 type:complete len:632 (+) Transcript_3681:1-1896(+)
MSSFYGAQRLRFDSAPADTACDRDLGAAASLSRHRASAPGVASVVGDYGGVAQQREVARVRGESAAAPIPEEDEGNQSRFFPLKPFVWLPPEVQVLIPKVLRELQSLPHLVLVFGTGVGFWLVAHSLLQYSREGCRLRYCQMLWITLIFVTGHWFYFARLIMQYDENLSRKQRNIISATKTLHDKYLELTAELSMTVGQSMDTQASLAERSFESKRRDFLNFLKRLSSRLNSKGGGLGGTHEADELLSQFRRFARHWLSIFSECTIAPVTGPLCVVAPDDLSQCKSVGEVASLLSERLVKTEVKFITRQREQDLEELSAAERAWRTMSQVHQQTLDTLKDAITWTISGSRQYSEAGNGHSPSSDMEVGLKRGTGKHRRWVHFSAKQGCRFGVTLPKAQSGADYFWFFPLQVHFSCLTIVIMGQEHFYLLLSFVLALPLLYLEAFVVEESKAKYEAAIIACFLCIGFALYDFVDIDVVKAMDLQLKEIEAERVRMEPIRERMLSFWNSTQQLADLWLHRTVPRLELMKFFHDEIEDAPLEQLTVLLTDINNKMQVLEASLPPLPLWCSEDVMRAEEKRSIGGALAELARAKNLQEAMKAVPVTARAVAEQSQHSNFVKVPPLALAPSLGRPH